MFYSWSNCPLSIKAITFSKTWAGTCDENDLVSDIDAVPPGDKLYKDPSRSYDTQHCGKSGIHLKTSVTWMWDW